MAKKALSITIDEDVYRYADLDKMPNKSQRVEYLLKAGADAVNNNKQISLRECIMGMKNLLEQIPLLASGELDEIRIRKLGGSIVIGKYSELFNAYVLKISKVYNVDYYLTRGIDSRLKVYYLNAEGKPIELNRKATSGEDKDIWEKVREDIKNSEFFKDNSKKEL